MEELGRWLCTILLSSSLSLPAAPGALPRAGQPLTPEQVAALLSALHPDYRRYIGSIRYGRTRLRPATLYAGLVRRGGLDPRDPTDAPRRGRGVANDLIIYADTWEATRSAAWLRLLADHEYFHARHLSGGAGVPLVGFENARADADYLEATAWGYVLARAREGIYGDLAPREWAELRRHYQDHQERFRAFVMDRQASAWAHYGRFLPEEGAAATAPAAAPPAAPSPSAAPDSGPGTR